MENTTHDILGVLQYKFGFVWLKGTKPKYKTKNLWNQDIEMTLEEFNEALRNGHVRQIHHPYKGVYDPKQASFTTGFFIPH